MEEDYLLLGGDEDTDMAEIAAAYKKQANQQNQELEAFQICQICIEKFDNTTRPRVIQEPGLLSSDYQEWRSREKKLI